MPAPLNKQPIFTATPVLKSVTLDAARFVSNIYTPADNANQPVSIFIASDSFGTLIERITITTCGDLTSTEISEKFIYLFIYDANVGKNNLYKTAYIPAITINSTTLNHEIEWVFAGGLLLPNNFELTIGASENSANSGRPADYLAITIEGSSYSEPS